jgi:hypothetical protein
MYDWARERPRTPSALPLRLSQTTNLNQRTSWREASPLEEERLKVKNKKGPQIIGRKLSLWKRSLEINISLKKRF